VISFAVNFNVKSPPIRTYQGEIKIILIHVVLRYCAETSVYKRGIEDLFPIGHTLRTGDRWIVPIPAIGCRRRDWPRSGSGVISDITGEGAQILCIA